MAESGENTGADIQAHEQTWSGFKAMMFYGTIGAALVGALVIFLIAPHK